MRQVGPRRTWRLVSDAWLRRWIVGRLRRAGTPEEIVGRLAADHPDEPAGGQLFRHRPRQGGLYRKRYGGRGRLGDFEGDTICCGRSPMMLTLVDPRRPTRKQIDRAVALLNDRPRKCLGWPTPTEVFFSK